MSQLGSILCIGEILWDSLPSGLFLGGAPFNVACHLHKLEEPAILVSRVGDDELGREIHRRVARQGLDTRFLQTDAELPTGFVSITLDKKGSPQFEIKPHSAWDEIKTTPELIEAAEGASAIVFGSLAQRSPGTRETIRHFWKSKAKKVFDVNLRPPFDDQQIVKESLENSSLVKLNDEELSLMAEWFDLPRGEEESTRALAKQFDCETICITRGARGAALLHTGNWMEVPGISVQVRDAVGAGDAFLAALLSTLLRNAPPNDALRYANAVGAFVASCNGATPPLEIERIKALEKH